MMAYFTAFLKGSIVASDMNTLRTLSSCPSDVTKQSTTTNQASRGENPNAHHIPLTMAPSIQLTHINCENPKPLIDDLTQNHDYTAHSTLITRATLWCNGGQVTKVRKDLRKLGSRSVCEPSKRRRNWSTHTPWSAIAISSIVQMPRNSILSWSTNYLDRMVVAPSSLYPIKHRSTQLTPFLKLHRCIRSRKLRSSSKLQHRMCLSIKVFSLPKK